MFQATTTQHKQETKMATATKKTNKKQSVTKDQYRKLAKQYAEAKQQLAAADKLEKQIRKELLSACQSLKITKDELTFKFDDGMQSFELSVAASQLSKVDNVKAIAAIGQIAFNANATISQKTLKEQFGIEPKIVESMSYIESGNVNVSLKKAK